MAFAVAMALAQRYAPGLLVGTIAPQTWLALVPLALIGVIDDWRNLPSAVRLPGAGWARPGTWCRAMALFLPSPGWISWVPPGRPPGLCHFP